jgi:hypothetical protein
MSVTNTRLSLKQNKKNLTLKTKKKKKVDDFIFSRFLIAQINTERERHARRKVL